MVLSEADGSRATVVTVRPASVNAIMAVCFMSNLFPGLKLGTCWHAGKAPGQHASTSRAGGGAALTNLIIASRPGPYPRQGSHDLRHRRRLLGGSIPAQAGEPTADGLL